MDELVIKLLIIIAVVSFAYTLINIVGLIYNLLIDYQNYPEFRTEILAIALFLLASSIGLITFILTVLIS